MATIHDLVTEFVNLSPSERLKLVITIRARRKINKTEETKKEKAAAKKLAKAEKFLAKLTIEDIQKLAAKFEEWEES